MKQTQPQSTPHKTCSPNLVEFISDYMIEVRETNVTDEILGQITEEIGELKDVHVYRGTYISPVSGQPHLPKVGDIIEFEGLKSWSTDYNVAYNFALTEHDFILDAQSNEIACVYELDGKMFCFTPAEYCYEDIAQTYSREKEITSIDVFYKVVAVEPLPNPDDVNPTSIFSLLQPSQTIQSFSSDISYCQTTGSTSQSNHKTLQSNSETTHTSEFNHPNPNLIYKITLSNIQS